jgi:hypothetical protein
LRGPPDARRGWLEGSAQGVVPDGWSRQFRDAVSNGKLLRVGE